jgi:iron complex transport system permease protein
MNDAVGQQGAVPLRGWVVQTRWVSARIDGRAIAVCSALSLVIVAIGCWSISVGEFPIPLSDVVRTLIGQPSADSAFIVGTLRLPRAIVGAGVGAALGMSGAIFQSLARNPLGSPDIVGFVYGASAGAFTVIVLLDGSGAAVSAGGVVGGMSTAMAVYLLAWKRGVHAYRLVLVGIGVGFTAQAVVEYLLTRASIMDAQQAMVWLTGSLNGRVWDHATPLLVALAALTPIAIWLQRWLDRLELGDDTATALGVSVDRAKLWLVAVGACLAAVAAAAAGPITFVAFVAGPIARRLTGSPGACLLPAAFVGAAVTLTADIAARLAFAPAELPVGIVTAVIGAPYLLWLLTRQIRTGAL